LERSARLGYAFGGGRKADAAMGQRGNERERSVARPVRSGRRGTSAGVSDSTEIGKKGRGR